MSFLRNLRRSPTNPSGEMPFFDHLEELRWRIIWSLLALIVATGVGFFVAIQFDLLSILKRPLDEYLGPVPLQALSVTEPFMLTFRLAVTIGLVLAFPIIAYQIWSFLAPALTSRERRGIVPALYLGAVLFAVGVAIGYFYVLPMTLGFLQGFQTPSLKLNPTGTFYFGTVIKLLLALGIVFELPVVILVLGTLGLVSSKFLSSKRRYALAGMAVTAALITPGDMITATVFMMAPLVFLYEMSIVLVKLVERSRARNAAADNLVEAQ